jgi:hypothetical protein
MLTTLLALCLSSSPTATPAAPSLEEFFRQPERVQIFLAKVDQTWGLEEKPDPDTRLFSGPFVLTREGPVLTKEERQTLAKIWVAPQDYTPRPPTKCGFNPDIALRFWRGTTWADAVMCFSCEKIAFFDTKGQKLHAGFLDDFAVLRKLARQAFPETRFHSGGR